MLLISPQYDRFAFVVRWCRVAALGHGGYRKRVGWCSSFFFSRFSEQPFEVVFENDTYALCCQGVAHIIVFIVVAVVCLQADIAVFCQQVLNVEVADKVVAVHGVVAVAEVAIQQQAVVQQSAGKGKFHFHVREVAFVAVEVRCNGPFVAELSQYVRQLVGYGRGGNRRKFAVLIGVAHVFRCVEAAQCKQIDACIEPLLHTGIHGQHQ